MIKYNLEQNVRKIAVLRANALGDFIFALPALQALREAYPAAEIVLLARDWHKAFLEGRPGPVDRVIPIPHGGLGDETDVAEKPDMQVFFEALQAESFDIAVQLHGGGANSNPFIRRLKARLSIGSRAPDAPPLDRNILYVYYQLETIRHLEIVALAGAKNPDLEPHITVTKNDLDEAYKVLPDTNRPLVALHPGASDSRRHWPTEKFAEVGQALLAEGAEVVITGTKPENYLAEAIKQKLPEAQNLCGQLSLNGLTGLLSRCGLVISNDSGPLHLAGAVGTPTVGIYWCGNMINSSPLTRTRFQPAISWRLNCPVCGLDCTKNRCDHAESFVADVTVEEVLSYAHNLL